MRQRIDELEDEVKKYRTAHSKLQREYDGLDLYRDQLEKDNDKLRNDEQASLEKIKTLKAQVNDTLEALDEAKQALDTAEDDSYMVLDACNEAQDELEDALEKWCWRDVELITSMKALDDVGKSLRDERIAHDDRKEAYGSLEKELNDVRIDHETENVALQDQYDALTTNNDIPVTLEEDLILVNTKLHVEINVLTEKLAEERIAHSEQVADLLNHLDQSHKGKDEHDTNAKLAQPIPMSSYLRHMHLNRCR
ncbi:hypothetical protein BKA63DRAFT_497405 [Paraphoma chrysanthemicola]|nr:hypothetical protein BKA63DRAFT_497405 [Paraphoma chrysanthemicola]